MALTHRLVIGQTLSGKSALEKQVASAVSSAGRDVIVYDPTIMEDEGFGLGGWPAPAFVTRSFERLQAVAWSSFGCHIVIDEAPSIEDVFGLRDLLARGRHRGHVVSLLGVRAFRIDKTAREMCTTLCCFNVSRSDAKILAEEWNRGELAFADQLPPLHYIYLEKHGVPQRGVVRFD